jgi:hypothetical protein
LAKHLDAVLKDVSSPTETTANVGPLREEVLRKALPGVRIFGPFGGFAEGVFRTEFAVLIGFGFGAFAVVIAGSWSQELYISGDPGAVPLISILKDLLYRLRMDKPNIALRRLKFIWVVRDTQSIGWFSSALCEVEAAVAATRDRKCASASVLHK